ncbi:hypothetical protein M422DRAFT_227393 [Sphaerobolus stellatus SS14]|uniref:Uncharacterized protein n=1 Tax=Sphaerobolus stellatus (strain SS14) TaxID=990650 RepID=A0A0C9VF85_SPHS4|nr:hypothetical protein M422DRAFT_227393 [Sphaerobolus stellatus SS14]
MTILAIDLDDVLCQTNQAAANWHNAKYDTHLTLSDFHYYHWWKNPGWGSPEETAKKVEVFYHSNEFENVDPVPGAVETMAELKNRGYRLIILTSREASLRKTTLQWIDRWFPSRTFEYVYFSEDLINSMKNFDETGWTWPTKAELCMELRANLLIDDSVENVLSCVPKHIPVLLFGDYEWGRRISTVDGPNDRLSFETQQTQRRINGQRPDWWVEDKVTLPDGVWKVDSWQGVIAWLEGPGARLIN